LDPTRTNKTWWEKHHPHKHGSHHEHHRFRGDVSVSDVKNHAGDVVSRAGSGVPAVLEIGAQVSVSDGVSAVGGVKVIIDFEQKSVATVGFLGGGLSVMLPEGAPVPLPNIAADASLFHNLLWKGNKARQPVSAIANGWIVGAGVSFTLPSPIPGVDFSVGAGLEFEAAGIAKAPEWEGPLAAGFKVGVGLGLVEVRGTADVTWIKMTQGPTTNCQEHTFTTACFAASAAMATLSTSGTDPITAAVVAFLGIKWA